MILIRFLSDKMHTKQIKLFLHENRIFIAIIAAALIARIYFFFDYHEIWWDSGVYIGMGKHIFSFGSAGLWEHLRPVLWSLILGVGWKIGLDVVLFGRIIIFGFSAASIFLFYIITLKIFNKKTAIITSVMFSFSTVFFFMGFRIYTEIPAMFFTLLGLYFFLESKYYFSGFVFGLAFLAKFPAPLILAAVLFILIYKKDLKNIFWVVGGFATPVIPFFVLNHFFYGNFLVPMVKGSAVIKEVLGCNVIRYKPFYYYFNIIFADNPLNVFALLGLFLFFRKPTEKKFIVLLCLAFPLIYFMQIHCRDFRYLILFIPFVIMFSGFGISSLIKKKKYFIPIVVLIIIVSAFTSINYYNENEQSEILIAEEYFQFLQEIESSNEIWTSNPLHAVYTNAKLEMIYYPIYNEKTSTLFYEYLTIHSKNVEYVLLDNCGGGLMCPSDNLICEKYYNLTFKYLDENFELLFDKGHGICWYKVYKNEKN